MRDLFGDEADGSSEAGDVSLALILHRETDKAWLLGESNDAREARWAPKSHVTRGEGRDAGVFTMPGWLAKERGWL